MSDERDYSGGSILVSFLLGGLVGAGLALLLAPQSGKETREKIKHLSGELKEKGETLARTAKERTLRSYEEGKESLTHAIEHGKETVQETKGIIAAAYEAGKEAMEKERKRLAEKA
ncbi:MAG: YtxH domain-containing protein [Nitrospirota bacterium]|nr:YtxH domain-containing protein [Nitrospirota bacterium]